MTSPRTMMSPPGPGVRTARKVARRTARKDFHGRPWTFVRRSAECVKWMDGWINGWMEMYSGTYSETYSTYRLGTRRALSNVECLPVGVRVGRANGHPSANQGSPRLCTHLTRCTMDLYHLDRRIYLYEHLHNAVSDVVLHFKRRCIHVSRSQVCVRPATV